MTTIEKERVAAFRAAQKSYHLIASALGVPENTIKSYCRRNGLASDYRLALPEEHEDVCAHCGKPLVHTPGYKKKKFCSADCRNAWWNAHPEMAHRKAARKFICQTCGVEFEGYGNQKNRKFCSRLCYGQSRRVWND